jgi:hypothetical protein
MRIVWLINNIKGVSQDGVYRAETSRAMNNTQSVDNTRFIYGLHVITINKYVTILNIFNMFSTYCQRYKKQSRSLCSAALVTTINQDQNKLNTPMHCWKMSYIMFPPTGTCLFVPY